MLLQRPHMLQQLDKDVGRSLAMLCGLEGLGRAIMVGLMPLVALEVLGSKQAVTNAYVGGGCLALFVTLNVGRLESWMPRRWVVTGGLLSLVVAANFFLFVDNWLLAIGIGLVAVAAGVFSVCLALFIMEYIDKRDFVRNESRRMFNNGLAWTVGPTLGLWLYTSVDERLPFIVAIGAALVSLGFFWVLRLGANPVLVKPRSRAPSPMRNIPRFFRQRYLRIAYAVTVVRGMFWVSFFVYAPIYVIEAGLSRFWIGIMISSVSALLVFSSVVERMAARYSARRVIILGFVIIGLGLTGLAAIGDARLLGLPVWMAAAIGATMLDVLGNIPFMRMVKPRERLPMTTVFSTWRELSSLVAPGLAALVMLVAPFWAYYLVVAALCFATAVWATFLPTRI
ncbi:MAG: MFS transporter [Acidimicrobiales bacterium]|jgi:MFS family permease|nr:MFS transporter [Acidimicrobiales bacterium]